MKRFLTLLLLALLAFAGCASKTEDSVPPTEKPATLGSGGAIPNGGE